MEVIIVDNIIQITVWELWTLALACVIFGGALGWLVLTRIDDVRSTHLTRRVIFGRVLAAVVALAVLLYMLYAVSVNAFVS